MISPASKRGAAVWHRAIRTLSVPRFWFVLLLLLNIATVAQAQKPPQPATTELPTQQQLQERIETIAASGGIEQGLQEQLLELYQEALERLMAAQNHADTISELEQLVRTAPEQLQRLQQQIKALPLPQSITNAPPAGASLSDIQQILAQEKATLAGLQNQVAELERQLRLAQSRPAKAREELATAKQRRQALERNRKLKHLQLKTSDWFRPAR